MKFCFRGGLGSCWQGSSALVFTLICGCMEAMDLLAQVTDTQLNMESRMSGHIRYSEDQWLLCVPPV